MKWIVGGIFSSVQCTNRSASRSSTRSSSSCAATGTSQNRSGGDPSFPEHVKRAGIVPPAGNAGLAMCIDAGAFGSGSLGLSPPPQPAARSVALTQAETRPHEALTRTLSGLESGGVEDELVTREVELPSGSLRVLQPRESAELPDDGPIEWAPIAPYWSVLWRSGVALARELDADEAGAGARPRAGTRVVELGCGLALPSIAAARLGATVLATDADPEALELAARNAELNGVHIEAVTLDWTSPAALLDRA